MGLDASLHIIYGYRLENNSLTDEIEKHTSSEDDGYIVEGTDKDYDSFYEELIEGDELELIDDYMCGNYQYIGLPILHTSSNYGEDFWMGYDIGDLVNQCSDERLDNLIQKRLPFLVGDFYDVAGLMNGELPKLYFVKRVW